MQNGIKNKGIRYISLEHIRPEKEKDAKKEKLGRNRNQRAKEKKKWTKIH